MGISLPGLEVESVILPCSCHISCNFPCVTFGRSCGRWWI